MTFSDTSQLRIAERWFADGTCEPTWLEVVEGVLSLRIEGGSPIAIPIATFESVMRRYGKPLADDVTLHGARLVLPAGRSVVLLRHWPATTSSPRTTSCTRARTPLRLPSSPVRSRRHCFTWPAPICSACSAPICNEVVDRLGAYGLWSRRSLVGPRPVTQIRSCPVDKDWWRAKLRRRREALCPRSNPHREREPRREE